MDIPITLTSSDSINHDSLDPPINPNLNSIDHQSSDSDSDDTISENYEVEAILDMRTKKGIKEYKIKWKDWPIDSCTWEVCIFIVAIFYSIQNFLMRLFSDIIFAYYSLAYAYLSSFGLVGFHSVFDILLNFITYSYIF